MSSAQSANHKHEGADPQQPRLLRVCRIGRAQGLKGEVNVFAFTDEPERRFAPGSRLEDRKGTIYTVQGSRRFKHRWIVRFQGLSDRNAAEALNGMELYVEADSPDSLAQEDAWYLDDLIGLEVRMSPANSLGIQVGRVVGRVIGVTGGRAQELIEIRANKPSQPDQSDQTDHQTMTGLIPFVEELVPDVNPAEGYISINPPGGLLPWLEDE